MFQLLNSMDAFGICSGGSGSFPSDSTSTAEAFSVIPSTQIDVMSRGADTSSLSDANAVIMHLPSISSSTHLTTY